ncbi:hypothetical protein NBRC3280_1320 [Acetobacter pasteurianus NBRC 3280]|uniref:Uncharacterized protein n=1 Tax=Acetobacter pasteurianus NBRC 3278 TaxID=1226660 RepID=A0A401X3A5_ACEPA|nr:hypothetical protein [Acetobacter pasteurianus]GCD58819.1 hypothetical protein NBRC3277_1394 [Acetobacter pasteurianus NBRC 3277]GCD62312.1 hypothetical protein NBRC3278_1405 [Acetobacter pasteurianus NBRC 3278]GCD68685.1 hypothetical protein NBRC3280_1320 [Acetobacter pasteurianus NBRC 3280]
MTTQNWPDPKRPGVPMLPERDGWHALENNERKEYWWDAHCSCWTTSEDGEFSWIPDDMSSVLGFSYIGPVLTPTQINEMLAAERERAARTAQEISDKYYNEREKAYHQDAREYADERMCAASECAKAIRNLGAAP